MEVAAGHGHVQQAQEILRWVFALIFISAGADKFFHVLADWTKYLAPLFARIFPGETTFMWALGSFEVALGLLVALRPAVGGLAIAAWLVAIILNLLILQAFYDVALHDLGLALAAFALARLSQPAAARPL